MNDFKDLPKRLTAPFCAVLLLVAAFYPYTERKGRLRVVPGVLPAAEALLVARDMKALPASQFQFIEIPWSSAVIRALGSGAADVAVVTLDSVLRMRESGQKVRVLMVLNQSIGADGLVARQNIAETRELKGLKIGLERSAGAYLLFNALQAAGLNMTDFALVPMFQSEMEPAMRNGEVDAVVAGEPWLTKLRESGTRLLYDSRAVPTPIFFLLVATERACTMYREELVQLIKTQMAMSQTLKAKSSTEAMHAVLKRERVSRDQWNSCLERLPYVSHAENKVMLEGERPKLEELGQAMQEQAVRVGLLSKVLSDTGWIDSSFWREASQ